MPKIKIAIEVNVKHETVQRWYTLEGQMLLDAIKTAADSGDEVIIKVQPSARQVRIMPLSTPPMFRDDFLRNGSNDDK